MTDPERVPNTVAAVQNLPEGVAVIYRHFGKSDKLEEAEVLRRLTFERGQQFLIAEDPELVIKTGADGVHFRRNSLATLPALWRERCPAWIITMAGQKSGGVYDQAVSMLDAVFVSSIFESQSPSGGAPIGTQKLKDICNRLDVPVIALGGLTTTNAAQLVGTGAAGLAGVSGLACMKRSAI